MIRRRSSDARNDAVQVLVVGAGPVGLTLAIDLGQRGIRTLVIERKSGPLHLPKMERTNPRSMEIYRRLGVAERIRAAGLPPDKAMDICMVSSLARPPLAQIKYPTVNEWRAQIAISRDGTQPREPYQLISQYTLEPLLMERLRELPTVELHFEVELEFLEQDAAGVRAHVRRLASGEAATINCQYLAGADGANSRVRELLGIALEGRRELGTVTNIFFRCDDLLAKSRVPQARHFQFMAENANGGAGGSIVMQDDLKHFGYHTAVVPEGDLTEFLRRQTGIDIHPKVLHVGPWTQNMLVAKAHSIGRVFLVGDANHVYIPAGGLGMNTGVVDAINLSWKLAAVLRGWGGQRLLDSYSIERNATARRTLAFVAYAVEGAVRCREGFSASMLENTAAANTALQEFLGRAVPLLRRVYDMHGADRGYRYVSPIVCEEASTPPVDDAYRYEPSTWPGSHLPHMWLTNDVAVYDRLGGEFSLVRTDSAVDVESLALAFASIGAQLTLVDTENHDIKQVYQNKVVLVRPDFHVAWRGDALPDDTRALAAQVAGRE